jgi:hypothetical protein
LLTPKRNRYLLWGLILSIVGVILIPFIIGIPIAGIGFSIFAYGVILSFAEEFASWKETAKKMKKMFLKTKANIQKMFVHKETDK